MHVLILPSWYPREKGDYSGSFFREQAIALASTGIKIGILTFVRHTRGRLVSNPGYFLGQLQRENDCGVDTWRVHYGAFSWCCNFAVSRMLTIYFRQYCSIQGKPDLLHAHCAIDGGARARFLSREHKLSYVVTEHSSGFARKTYSRCQLDRARSVFAYAHKNITVSSALRLNIESAGISLPAHVVIPNMLPPLMEDAPWPPCPSEKTGTFQFLCIGTLNTGKRQDMLIRAFASGFYGQSASLTLVGTGPLYEQLVKLCEELHITNMVRLAGGMTREQVLQEIDCCDALILASRNETFGVVLIEAISRGKPIIATDCGGPREIVSKANGLLVNPENIEQLKAAMLMMVREHKRFLPEIIRSQCLKKFSRIVICSSIIRIYEEVLSTEYTRSSTEIDQ